MRYQSQPFIRKALGMALAAVLGAGAMAQSVPSVPSDSVEKAEGITPRVGVGQPDAATPPVIGRLQLHDPLVQQKYMNNPDMLRFLRATYSEACARGNLVGMAKTLKADTTGKVSNEMKGALSGYLSSQRIWKMSTLEMERLFTFSYIQTAFYCDCLMKEVSDLELVNPRKGLEVIQGIKPATDKMCQQMAAEKTEKYKAVVPESYLPVKK